MRGAVLAVVFAFCGLAQGQNAWVRRQKKENDANKIRKLSGENGGDLDAEAAALMNANRRASGMANMPGFEAFGNMDMDQLWDTMMDSPEVKAILEDPAKIREMLADNPLLNAMPGMAEQVEVALNSEQFKDPAKLQAAMREGMEAFKTVGKEFSQEIGKNMMDMLENPDKIAEALQQLGDPKVMEDAMKQLMGAEGAGALGGGDGGGGAPDFAQFAKMLGQDLTPDQLQKAMADTQKLLKDMGVDPDAFKDFGLDDLAKLEQRGGEL